MKLELSDDLVKLWEQAGALDQEIRQSGVTVPVGLRELTPMTRETHVTDALQRHISGSREAIQRYKDQQDNREQARKAAEDVEKERQAHQGEAHDDVGYYKPIPGTFSLVLSLPEKPANQRQEILRQLGRARNYGGVRRVIRLDEGAGRVRVQYAPKTQGERADIDLIGVVFTARNGFAIQEQNAAEEKARQMPGEHLARELEEEARWASYGNN